MSTNVLLNILNKLRKSDKMQVLEYFITFLQQV